MQNCHLSRMTQRAMDARSLTDVSAAVSLVSWMLALALLIDVNQIASVLSHLVLHTMWETGGNRDRQMVVC